MKKSTFTLLVLSLFILKVTAQQVTEVQRSLITKQTATWCPNCGTWGWTLFRDLLDDNSGKAVFFAAHHSGQLQTAVATEITNNFGGFYQPMFFFNSTNQNATPSNSAATRASVKSQVDNAFAASPVANSGFEPVYSNGKIQVDAKVKFFKAAEGEFYAGIYLVEDNVINYQNNVGNNANHKKVLRNSFTASSWGEPLANGAVTAGQEFTKSFSLEVGDLTGHDYEIVGIIWKKTGSKYEVVNVWSTTSINPVTAVSDVNGLLGFDVSPSPAVGSTTVRLELEQSLESVTIDLFDITGKKVQTIFQGQLVRGSHNFMIEKEIQGVYLVRMSAGAGVSTRKVVFQ